MKTVTFGQHQGYPMYQKFKAIEGTKRQLDIVVENESVIEVGDTMQHVDRSTWKVKEVLETRVAKGNHPYPVTFQSLIVQ